MFLGRSFLLFLVVAHPCTSHLLRHSHKVGSLNLVMEDAKKTCAPLANKGTHFTVDIEVGTPSQKFSVVADTGSDSIIVPSCICQKQGVCSEKDRCFQGTNKSSTFLLEGMNATQLSVRQPKQLPVVQMVFGSGAIQSVIATDVVKVGSLKATMKEGLLLMVSKQLNMNGPFEGILGLGQPKNETELKRQQKLMEEQMEKRERALATSRNSSTGSSLTPKQAEEVIKRMMEAAIHSGGGRSGAAPRQGSDDVPIAAAGQQRPHVIQVNSMQQPIVMEIPAKSEKPSAKSLTVEFEDPKDSKDSDDSEEPLEQKKYKSVSFLQATKISRFSMCFNDRGKDGALHLGTPKDEDALTSVGTVHWGLDFRGITIGDQNVSVDICSPESKKEGQKSACGAIPDTGTTLFTAPKDHLVKVLESICDGWERCKKATSYGLQKKKAEMVAMLLQQCGDWITEENGLDELPTLHFQLVGQNGKKKTLSFDGAAYVIETLEAKLTTVTKEIGGIPFQIPKRTGKKSKVCAPAFGAMEMNTIDHGPVWILGSPLFHEYSVGYDLDESEPAISFSQGPCGCSKEAALVSKTHEVGKRMARQPRQLQGPPRMPSFDLSMGL